MKSNPKIVFVLIFVGIVFTLSPIISKSFKLPSGISNEINLDKKDLKMSVDSGRIHIDNNWTDAKVMGICTGSGTIYNPYIIKNLIIDGEDSGACIHIRNSDVYFKIEKCSLFNAGPGYSGILLVDVNNSQLINNYCYDNGIGIIAVRSEYNVISGNTVDNNSEGGIELYASDNNIISENTANGAYIGIHLRFSQYNDILGNIVKENSYGIYLSFSDNNTISENTVNHNNEDGITLHTSHGNDILENTLNNNENGIWLRECYDNEILENAVNGSHYGIWLLYSAHNNKIWRNTIRNNFAGIIIWSPLSLFPAYNNSIFYNCLSSNTHNGYDNGTKNQWDDGTMGNYWSNYTGLDEDDDGIGDVPHNIDGDVGAQDNFPLMKCPIITEKGVTTIPGYELFFLFGILSTLAFILSKKLRKP